MKVIKEGKWNVPWSCEYTCKTCEAELLVEEADVKAPDYQGSGYFTATCTVCGHPITLRADGLPQRIKEKLNLTRKWSSGNDDWR